MTKNFTLSLNIALEVICLVSSVSKIGSIKFSTFIFYAELSSLLLRLSLLWRPSILIKLFTESILDDKYSLKPENIIVDKNGFIRLTDFGLSKILEEDDEKTKTICGTPEYLAPEIIKKLGHRMEVDWWCLGCLIYEMTTGFPPFRNENRMKLFEEIIYSPVDVKDVNILIIVVISELTGFDSKALNKGSKPTIRTWWSW